MCQNFSRGGAYSPKLSRERIYFRRSFDEMSAFAEAIADKNSGIISEPKWKSQQRELLPIFRGPLFGFSSCRG